MFFCSVLGLTLEAWSEFVQRHSLDTATCVIFVLWLGDDVLHRRMQHLDATGRSNEFKHNVVLLVVDGSSINSCRAELRDIHTRGHPNLSIQRYRKQFRICILRWRQTDGVRNEFLESRHTLGGLTHFKQQRALKN